MGFNGSQWSLTGLKVVYGWTLIRVDFHAIRGRLKVTDHTLRNICCVLQYEFYFKFN